MKRVKRHKIKQEMPETSTSRFRDQEEHDLAYYIHDRVELMHQVFSVIKPKELKAMAPECVHHISVDDLQELCTEELLGISSKRLCAVLDGAEPPTDTESSSSEHMETISLDSISSDDEILSQHSSKKKHKHRKHKSKNKHKHKNSKTGDKADPEVSNQEERSKASRAGLTVLELLELQARARAIRAQLQQDNTHAPAQPQQAESQTKDETSEDEVEIKEEPAEVVEISSEDEKPNVEDLPAKPPSPSKDQTPGNLKTVTKRVNNLIVTVPHTKQKKIVLNRNKNITTNVTSNRNEVSKPKDSSQDTTTKSKASSTDTATKAKASTSKESTTKTDTQEKTKASEVNNKVQSKPANNKPKQKKKQRKKDKKSDKEEDHDEITLQLSDTEKMDLLEDFDRKNYENFTSSSEDSESSSESESDNDTSQDSTVIGEEKDTNATNTQNDSKPIDSNDVNSEQNNAPVTVEEVSAKPEEVDSTCDKEMLIPEINEQEETNVGKDSKEAIIIEDLQPENYPKDTKDTHKNEKSTSPSAVSPVRNSLNNTNANDFDKNVKDCSPSDSSPVLNSSKDTTEYGTQDKSSNIEQDVIQSPIISSDERPIIEIDINKSLNMEVETCESTEEVHTVVESHKDRPQVIESIIIQVRNVNFHEPESKETQQNMRSVIVRVGNDNSESSSENGSRNAKSTKEIRSTVEKVNEGEMRATDKNESTESIEEGEITNTNKELSEGEITENEERETQTNNTKSPEKSEVVCVSDDEGDKRKKKKKKDKKSKKEKKSKKSKSDFREGADQNFFREENNIVVIQEELDEKEQQNNSIVVEIHDGHKEKDIVVIPEETEIDLQEKQIDTIVDDPQEQKIRVEDDIVSLDDDDDDDDDIYEILEISDDSSCYEVEGISVSKEPTAAEIAALSAKIDEINHEDVIVINEEGEDYNEENGENETNLQENKTNEEIDNISWRDRYLGSNKVKRVLTTSNILNALRKKNKELKRKLEESKKKMEQVTEGDKEVLAEISEFVEGSIEHFNTLEGSTKYVDPVVPEVPKESNPEDENKEGKEAEVGIKQVTKEMEKDAKQLLKMYKRLLKYNDINKKKDPTKKKKKKHKKNKEKDTATKEK